jgi:hypothetical protein
VRCDTRAPQLHEIRLIPVFLVKLFISLHARGEEAVGGPYSSGILAGGTHFEYQKASPQILAKVGRIKAICERFGVPIKAAALQFSMAHPASAAVIPGATRPDRIKEDYAALAAVIPDDFWHEMRAQELVSADAPLAIDLKVASKARASATIDIPASPEQVWKLIGGFNSLPDWLPYIPKSELSDGGRVKHLANPNGQRIVERLEEFDNSGRSDTYSILEAPFPVKEYLSTLRVQGADGGGARVEWSGEFTPNRVSNQEASRVFQSIFDDGLKALANAFSTKKTATSSR